MSDIFREVEEEVRREHYQKLWRKYGDIVVGAAALIILGAAGSELYRYYTRAQTEAASDAYQALAARAAEGNPDEIAEAFNAFADDAPDGYAAIARLRAAAALAEAGKRDEAVKLYDELSGSGDPLIAGLARIRAAWLVVEYAPRAEVETRLAPLTDPASPWRHLAREVLAYAALRAGAREEAAKAYAELAADPQAPEALRGRTRALAEHLGANPSAAAVAETLRETQQ